MIKLIKNSILNDKIKNNKIKTPKKLATQVIDSTMLN
jgi:hypothetical protein